MEVDEGFRRAVGTQWGAVIIVEGTLSRGEAGIAGTQGGVLPLPYTLASCANFLSLRALICEMEMIPLCRDSHHN